MSETKLICVLLGGPTYRITVRGKVVPFELHPYCGPNQVHKVTGDPVLHPSPGFWDAIELWEKGGKRMDGDLCVLPQWCAKCEGRGDEVKHVGGKHWEIVGQCPECKGQCVVFPVATNPKEQSEWQLNNFRSAG